jgi:putative effector of murein hydrolase LrgA (UPF0299 family)
MYGLFLSLQLPYKSSSFGPSQEKAVLESATGLLELSSFHFVPVVEGIMKLIDTIQQVQLRLPSSLLFS